MILAEIAPRLARARAAWIAFEADRDRRRQELRDDQMRLERLVGHRELQAARAIAATGRARTTAARRGAGEYLVARERKLAEAREALARVHRRLRELEAAR